LTFSISSSEKSTPFQIPRSCPGFFEPFLRQFYLEIPVLLEAFQFFLLNKYL
jgi:hypothetical protein